MHAMPASGGCLPIKLKTHQATFILTVSARGPGVTRAGLPTKLKARQATLIATFNARGSGLAIARLLLQLAVGGVAIRQGIHAGTEAVFVNAIDKPIHEPTRTCMLNGLQGLFQFFHRPVWDSVVAASSPRRWRRVGRRCSTAAVPRAITRSPLGVMDAFSCTCTRFWLQLAGGLAGS